MRQLERGGRDTKDERAETRSLPARKARRDTPNVATPACDGTKTPRGPHMILQHTVLRDGSTWAARAWTCVAGHNIVPRAQRQTSAARFNTPHKHANATQHQHTSRVNKAGRSGCSTHSSQAREKCSCSQGHTPVQHGPEGEARGGSAPRGAITNSRDLWVTSKCCGKNDEHDTSSCKCPQNVLSERNWRNSSSSVCRCERRQRLRRFRGG